MVNIVLTGFMGTGKSTAGKMLARDLGLKFLDMDELIEKEAGMPVREIFSKLGEDRFRSLEREVVEGLTAGNYGSGLVVSTGGGAVVDRRNREALRKWGRLICLTASPEEILERVGRAEKRPLLAGKDRRKEIEKLLEERREAYLDCDLTVDTTGRSVQEVVGEIKGFLA